MDNNKTCNIYTAYITHLSYMNNICTMYGTYNIYDVLYIARDVRSTMYYMQTVLTTRCCIKTTIYVTAIISFINAIHCY